MFSASATRKLASYSKDAAAYGRSVGSSSAQRRIRAKQALEELTVNAVATQLVLRL
jgi:hypothetical protein